MKQNLNYNSVDHNVPDRTGSGACSNNRYKSAQIRIFLKSDDGCCSVIIAASNWQINDFLFENILIDKEVTLSVNIDIEVGVETVVIVEVGVILLLMR